MSDYICPYTCSYRTNSGFCGRTGGAENCQQRRFLGYDSETRRFIVEPVAARNIVIQSPQTNFDQLRSMSIEELAVVIAWPYLASPPWCSEHTTCPYISEDPTPCDKCALQWLKQEVSE